MKTLIAGMTVLLALAWVLPVGGQTADAPALAGFSQLPTTHVSPQSSEDTPSTPLYDNTGTNAQYFYSGQAGGLAIDDLHLDMRGHAPGVLTEIAFEYYEPVEGGETFDARVYIYDNPEGLDAALPLIGGPYVVTGLGSGRALVLVPIPDDLLVGPDMWVGVQLTSSTAGLVINGTPSVGSSHDYYVENGRFYYFGGNPQANFALRVDANLPPRTLDDSYGTDEEVILSVAAPGVLTNDTDIEGDSMAVSVDTWPDHGTLFLDPDGGFTYTPDIDFNGADSFTYLAGDGGSFSHPGRVILGVRSINDPPVAVEDSTTTLEDTSVQTANVLDNDHDVDGDPLTIVAFDATSVQGGIVSQESEGVFLYAPPADFNGADVFYYLLGDGTGAVSPGMVKLGVLPVNDIPVAADDAYTTDEDVALNVDSPGVLGNDEDVDGDSLTAILESGPSHGSFTLNEDGSFAYTPTADYSGSDSFRYVAWDGSAGSPSALVLLTVNEGNEPPVAVCRDTTVVADLDGVAWAQIDDGSYDPQGESITLEQIPPPPYPVGTHIVALVVTDVQGGADTCTATVTVGDTTPPTVNCYAQPILKIKNLALDDDEEEEEADEEKSRYLKDTYLLTFEAWDNSGQVDVSGGVDAGCDTIPIQSGQIVRLKFKKDKADTIRCRVESKLKDSDILEIKGMSEARLMVIAMDASGNTATCELDLSPTKEKEKDKGESPHSQDNEAGTSSATVIPRGDVISTAPGAGLVSGIGFQVSGEELVARRIPTYSGLQVPGESVPYDNLAPAGISPPFYSGQAGNEAIDDLHGRAFGTLSEFAFEYIEPATGGDPFDAFVTFYDNPDGSDDDIRPVAGPYRVLGLTSGRNVITIDVFDGPYVGPDLWMGVRFTSPTAGLVINDGPSIGSSHDYYVEGDSFYFFGGDPVANFGLRVTVTLSPTSVGDDPARPFGLQACYPNPFSSRTWISYETTQVAPVRIDVFDAQGRHVVTLADRVEGEGEHGVDWDGRDTIGRTVRAGLYFVRMESREGTRVQRVIRLP